MLMPNNHSCIHELHLLVQLASRICLESWSAMIMVPLKTPVLYSSGKGQRPILIFSLLVILLTSNDNCFFWLALTPCCCVSSSKAHKTQNHLKPIFNMSVRGNKACNILMDFWTLHFYIYAGCTLFIVFKSFLHCLEGE